MQARRQSNHVRALGAIGTGLLAAMLSACGGGGSDTPPPGHRLAPCQRPATRRTGALFGAALQRAAAHPAVGQVRGRGLMRGIELVRPGTREPDADTAGRVQEALREAGVIVGRSGQHRNVLRINPPLCVTADDAAEFDAALQTALQAVPGAAQR